MARVTVSKSFKPKGGKKFPPAKGDMSQSPASTDNPFAKFAKEKKNAGAKMAGAGKEKGGRPNRFGFKP